MVYKTFEDVQLQSISRSVRLLKICADFAVELRDKLGEVYDLKHAREEWGVVFTPDAEGAGALIETPYGQARAVVENTIANNVPQIRYVIEKAVRSKLGEVDYFPVWAVSVGADGIVSSDDLQHALIPLNSFHHNDIRNGVGKVAMSIIYAIASARVSTIPKN